MFLNTSWAHYLDPSTYGASAVNIDHFNARRFQDANQQHQIVSEIMRLVIGKLRPAKDIVAALEWSINEITDNVLVHARASLGGIVQVATYREFILFCVADSGRGILNSMREGHPELRNDTQAIGEAVKAGVTRDPKVGQGNGLAGTLRVATMSDGRFSVWSKRGRLTVARDNARQNLRPASSEFHGTMVTASVGRRSSLNIEEALEFAGVRHDHLGILDFCDEEDEAMVIRLQAETNGVGSRAAGAFIREKCRHLLSQEPAKPLVLDWAGVPLISSSFADEAFGKLFVGLGPLTFSARVRHRNMEAVNAGLVDKAILQRVTQTNAVPSRRVPAVPEPYHRRGPR